MGARLTLTLVILRTVALVAAAPTVYVPLASTSVARENPA
jgi:hypothetical protein